MELVNADERAIKDMPGKEPFIAVTELRESSVDFSVRVWTTTADLWAFRFETLERVKKAFDRNGVTTPFPHRGVHVFKEELSTA